MTLVDIIDEELRNLGVSEDEINDARNQTLLMQMQTAEDRKRIFRELSDEEIIKFKGAVKLIFVTVLSHPALAKKLMDELQNDIKRN